MAVKPKYPHVGAIKDIDTQQALRIAFDHIYDQLGQVQAHKVRIRPNDDCPCCCKTGRRYSMRTIGALSVMVIGLPIIAGGIGILWGIGHFFAQLSYATMYTWFFYGG